MTHHVGAKRFQELYWRVISLQLFFEKMIDRLYPGAEERESFMYKTALAWVNLKAAHSDTYICNMFELAVEYGDMSGFLSLTDYIPCWLAGQLLEIEMMLLMRLNDSRYPIPAELLEPLKSLGKPYSGYHFQYGLRYPDWLLLSLPSDFFKNEGNNTYSFNERLLRACDGTQRHKIQGKFECPVCKILKSSITADTYIVSSLT